MANPNYPNDPGYRNPNDPLRGTSQSFLPTWGWAALVIAAIVVFGLIFSWGDGTQQQAEFPTTPPATSNTPPPLTPATPPAQSPTAPPAQNQ